MSIVRLGNTAPVNAVKLDPEGTDITKVPSEQGITPAGKPGPDGTITTFVSPVPLGEAIQTITRTYDGWHSDEPPAWVESDDEALAAALASHYSADGHECAVGRPEGWVATDDVPAEASEEDDE